MKRTMKRPTIDPERFSESGWRELYYACELLPRSYENRREAKPFSRSTAAISRAIAALKSKVKSIETGMLGAEMEPGQDADWISDLEEGIGVLASILDESKRSAT